MTDERRAWDTDNVQAVCWTLAWVGAVVGLCFVVQRCAELHRDSERQQTDRVTVQARRDTENAKVEPARLREAMQGCHDACAPGQVRAWSDKECACD